MASIGKLPSGTGRCQACCNGDAASRSFGPKAIALNRPGLIDASAERDRRPTQEGHDQISAKAEADRRLLIPLARLIKLAVATAMRQDAICRVLGEDCNAKQSASRLQHMGDLPARRRCDGGICGAGAR